MNPISAYVEKDNEQATLELYKALDKIEFPKGVQLAINNLKNAKSGVLRPNNEKGAIDISLAHCFKLEDVVRELLHLIATGK